MVTYLKKKKNKILKKKKEFFMFREVKPKDFLVLSMKHYYQISLRKTVILS